MEVLKEYLNKVTHEFKCFGGVPKGPDWIEIPEGAEVATYSHALHLPHFLFWKKSDKPYFDWTFDPKLPDKGWFRGSYNLEEYQVVESYKGQIVWQRTQIQKKEYLVPQNAGGYMFRTAYDNGWIPKHWIEVPEGAQTMIEQDSTKYPVTFLKSEGDCSYCWWNGKSKWVPICPDFVDFRTILWQRPTLPEALPFIDDEPSDEKVRFNSDAFSHKHSQSEPPAYYGNAIRPKPRQRMRAGIGREVINVAIIQGPNPAAEVRISDEFLAAFAGYDDCIRVPKPSADYLFNTVKALLNDDFVSKDQKECVLHHLNYLKAH